MYSLNLPVSQLRTKVRQEFERHRYVNKLSVVDILLFQSHSEFQVCRASDRHQESSCWEAGEWGQRESESRSPVQMLMQHTAGNVELLEANTTCYEVFSRNRESDSKIACKFHARLSGGRHCDNSNEVPDG